jgi:hypothetical protein
MNSIPDGKALQRGVMPKAQSVNLPMPRPHMFEPGKPLC